MKHKYDKQFLKIDMINSNFNQDNDQEKNQFDIDIDVQEECNYNQEANILFDSCINNDNYIDLIDIKNKIRRRSNSWQSQADNIPGFEKADSGMKAYGTNASGKLQGRGKQERTTVHLFNASVPNAAKNNGRPDLYSELFAQATERIKQLQIPTNLRSTTNDNPKLLPTRIHGGSLGRIEEAKEETMNDQSHIADAADDSLAYDKP